MAKFMKSLKSSTAAVAVPAKTEFDAADYLFHVVEVVGGKKLEIGTKADCVAASVGRFGPYVRLMVDGVETTLSAKQVKILKPIEAAKAALVKAEREAAAEATLIVGGTIQRETFEREEDGRTIQGAVLVRHHGWFKPLWFTKCFVTVLDSHEDGEQVLLEIARWKIHQHIGPRGIADLEALQAGYEKMLTPPEPVKPAGKSMVTGKTTLIRRK